MAKHRGHNEGTIWERRNTDKKVTGYTAEVTLRGTGSGGKRAERKRKTFKTKAEARAWLDEMKSAERQGRASPGKSDTVSAYLAKWLETIRPALRDSTYHSYAGNVRRVEPYIGHVQLDMLKPAQVQDLYAELGKSLSARSVQQAHMVLHKALEDALKLDLVFRNVTEAVTVPRPERRESTTFAPEQLHALFDGTKEDRFHALWVVMGTHGLRLGEALGLKWADIDFGRGLLTISRSLLRKRSGGGLHLGKPKTQTSLRTLMLTDEALEALKRHQERQVFEKRVAKAVWHDNDLVFCTGFGTPLDQGRIHHHWVRTLERLELPRIRVHDLRHTATTVLAQLGVHPSVTQRIVGHSNIQTTLSIYTHVSPEMQREAIERLNALYSSLRKAT